MPYTKSNSIFSHHGRSILYVCVMLSALGVVTVKQNSRISLAKLHELKSKRAALYNLRTQLLLEQSAWTTYGRIDRLAREKLAMVIPDEQHTVTVRP